MNEVNADESLWQKATRPDGEWPSSDLDKTGNDLVAFTSSVDAHGLPRSCSAHVSGTADGLASSHDDVDTWSLSDCTVIASQLVLSEPPSTLTGEDVDVTSSDSSSTSFLVVSNSSTDLTTEFNASINTSFLPSIIILIIIITRIIDGHEFDSQPRYHWLVSNGMGDCLRAGISQYITSHPSQLSLLPSVGWEMSTGQSAVMHGGSGVKAGWLIPFANKHVGDM